MQTGTMNKKQLLQILKDNSTDKYFIEYHGFLSNHLAHGVIALFRLGASYERIQQWIKWYVTKLENATDHPDPTDDGERDVGNLLGQRTHFYTLFKHYKTLYEGECNKSLDQLISTSFPKLYPGMFASLLHGLIHTGYGYATDDTQTVLEGLAYLHHSFVPTNVNDTAAKYQHQHWGQGSHSPLEVIDMMTKDPEISSMVRSKAYLELNKKIFQARVIMLLQEAGQPLLSYTYKLKCPDWYNPGALDMIQIIKLNNWIIDVAISVYASSEPKNDFMLLHGVTGAWSLCKLISLMKDPQEASKALQLYLCLVFAVYVADNTPPLNAPDFSGNASEVSQSTWDGIIKEAIEEDRDEHVYKLIQVCYERWEETGRDASSAQLYVAASKDSVRYPLAFPDYPVKKATD